VVFDLAERSVARLLIEGGARVLAQFLARDLADELQLATAPLFVADPAAPRLNPGVPSDSPMTLAEVRRLDDVVLHRYLLGPGGPELTCDQCFDQLDRYVEIEVADGARCADEEIAGMRAHLQGCQACHEEHDSLLALLRSDRPA